MRSINECLVVEISRPHINEYFDSFNEGMNAIRKKGKFHLPVRQDRFQNAARTMNTALLTKTASHLRSNHARCSNLQNQHLYIRQEDWSEPISDAFRSQYTDITNKNALSIEAHLARGFAAPSYFSHGKSK